jgi:hypothetical protein
MDRLLAFLGLLAIRPAASAILGGMFTLTGVGAG